MRETLTELLDNIYKDIEDDKSISLMGGEPGIILFKIHYLKHVRQHDLSNIIDNIQELSESSINDNIYSSFCGGQAGINWFFRFLYKHDYIDKNDYELICSSDYALAEASLNLLERDFYDFLHGATGIAHHLLYTKNKRLKQFFNKFLTRLISLMGVENPILYSYDFDLSELDKTKINPSLSHGMTSILKFCIECYKEGIYKRKSKFIAKNIIDFLLANMNTDNSYCYFPYTYDLVNKDTQKSRLSWCYGDLTIAYVMYQYGLQFDDKHVKDKALEILCHSSKRRSDSEAGIIDAGFCHGTAGVAYVFSKLWYKTKDPAFHDASTYWFKKTIDHSVHSDGLAGYKKYDNVNQTWVKDSSLLTGVAGIGLAIIGHLYEDYTWDYCLMLND